MSTSISFHQTFYKHSSKLTRVVSWRILTPLLIVFIICILIVQHLSQSSPETELTPTTYMYLEHFLVKANRSPESIPELPDLRRLEWPPVQVASKPAGVRDPSTGNVYPLPEAFEPVLSLGQRELSKHLLRLFSQLMFDNGLGDRFLLYGGTLLGSLRHHDLIPWDDDMDLLVDLSIRPRLQTLLQQLGPNYQLTKQRDRDKFYTATSPSIDVNMTDLMVSRRSSQYSWGWPFLDIGYYRRNKTHISEVAASYGRTYEWPIDVVLPLRFRPLGVSWYPAPYRTVEFLRLTYGASDQCVIFGYSHVLEGSGPRGERPCVTLADRYAFVEHCEAKNSNQQLIASSHVTDKFLIGEERLISRDSSGHTRVVHTIHLPVLESETRTETYGFRGKDSTD